MTVIRVFGPPGTGKTYTLNIIVYHLVGVENNIAFLNQYGLELPYKAYTMPQIAYISFMNSAVDELLNRLGVRRNYRNGPWGTLHGLALHLLLKDKVVPRELVTNTFRGRAGLYWWRKKFCYEFGLPYDPNEEAKTLPGNQLFDGISYVVNVFYPKVGVLDDVLDRLYDVYENTELVGYAERWIKFKRQNKIIDFDDMLMLAYDARPALDVPVLIADEFQDFSPLQYEIFRAWAEGKDYVIVAGDDDQVVSRYNGSDPRFLVELPGLGSDYDAVLKQSFRIPLLIHEASQVFIRTYVKYRYPKEFFARDEKGKIIALRLGWHRVPELALRFAKLGRSVLILARTNSLVRDIEMLLLQRGVEYHRFKTRLTQVWRDFINRLIDVVEAVRNERKVSEVDLRFFFRFTKVSEERVNVLAKAFAKGYAPLDAYRIFNDPIPLIDFGKVAEYLGSQERAELALKALTNILSGQQEKLPGKIFIETIHAAKGREADVVIVLDHITPRIFNEMSLSREDFEAEMRVWYVAMTRARHVLIFVPLDAPLSLPLLGKAGFKKVEVVA